MSEATTIPLSRLARRALVAAQVAFEQECQSILRDEAVDRGIPQDATFDPQQGAFVLPAEQTPST